jgi:hypothetical protein
METRRVSEGQNREAMETRRVSEGEFLAALNH